VVDGTPAPTGAPGVAHNGEMSPSLPGGPRDRCAHPAFPGYEIVGKLGEGGMGAVYLARDLKLKREVALKTLRATESRPELIARFWAEAEVMAAVLHPHVVQVFELGKDPDRPFLAMEHLSGGSLADLMKPGAGMAPREAVALVEKVARGVAAAHELGIVHRDLKPKNVLFSSAREPKVVDFGLAKRTASDMTESVALMGTPLYMAPEQAAGRAKFVGPPADVWALGVVLYECLSGNKPFEGDTVEAVLGRISSVEPVGLRARVRGLPRDLDTIVTKCLSKAPERRYPTASELADDLGRFLRGEPIAARPPGWVERTRLWGRRHPVRMALVLMSVLFLVAQSVAIALVVRAYESERQAKATAQERERAASAARDAAQQAAAESGDMATLLVRVFDLSTPLGFEPLNADAHALHLDDPAARQLLTAAIQHVRARPPTRSLARAELLDALGSACRSRGMLPDARELLNEAYAIRKELLGADNKEVAASQHNLGWLAQDEGHFDEAQTRYRQALELRCKWLGADHPLVTVTMFNLAWVTAHQYDSASPERIKTAEKLLRDILERQKKCPCGGHGDPVLTRVALALVVYAHNDPEHKTEAETLMGEILRELGKHPRSKLICDGVRKYFDSKRFQDEGKFPEAIELRREALKVLRGLVGDEHFFVAAALGDLAALLAQADRYDEAGTCFVEAMRIAKKNFPSGHWLVARTIVEAADKYASIGRFEDAEHCYQEGLAMAVAVGRPDIWQRARAGLVRVLQARGRGPEAEALSKLTPPKQW
jgi:tetratricopeptide (TPR) repeat protein/tRNA A-37 threonylcarbamoyl transferase component Bud32